MRYIGGELFYSNNILCITLVHFDCIWCAKMSRISQYKYQRRPFESAEPLAEPSGVRWGEKEGVFFEHRYDSHWSVCGSLGQCRATERRAQRGVIYNLR